jgi:hypothetical protein
MWCRREAVGYSRGLRRDIQPASTGTSYHIKFVNDIWTAGALDMNDVECRSRCRCVRKNFLKAAEGRRRIARC